MQLALRNRTGRLPHAPLLCHGNRIGHRLHPGLCRAWRLQSVAPALAKTHLYLDSSSPLTQGLGGCLRGFRGLRVLCSTGCSLSRSSHCAAGHVVSVPRDTWWPASGRQEGCFLCWGGGVVAHRHFSGKRHFIHHLRHPLSLPTLLPFTHFWAINGQAHPLVL